MQRTKNTLVSLLFIIAVCVIMYYGSGFLIPIAFGMLFAFLVAPVHYALTNRKVNTYVAAVMSVGLIVLFFAILISVFGWQVSELAERSDEIEEVLVEKQEELQMYINRNLGISFQKQGEYARQFIRNLKENAMSFLGGTGSAIGSFFLSLIYAVLMLSERKRFKNFLLNVAEKEERAERTALESAEVVAKYLTGKLTIISILAIAYSVGFLIAGIPYAVLLAIFAAFLSFIPYVGNIIGGSIAWLITLATGGTYTDLLLIFVIMSAAQVVESYILEPWIVGSNVDLNPFFSIISVIGMSMLWGPAGAVIALPLAGAVRIILGKTREYNDLGYLMSNEEEEEVE